MTPLLKVLTSHSGVLLQDAGRRGGQASGFCQAGALDLPSAWLAHWLVHGAWPAHLFEPSQFYQLPPLVEITQGNCRFEALTDITVAHAGALGPLRVNQQPVACGMALSLRAGDVLDIGFYRHGLRGYLAVNAQLDAPSLYQSCCRVDREHVGLALHAGQQLCGTPRPAAKTRSLPYVVQHALLPPPVLHLDYLPQAASFDAAPEQAALEQQLYRVSPQSNRMGVRCIGPSIWRKPKASMLSEALSNGTIQLPPDGQPLVLLNDHQTIGGYPRIGTLASYSMYALAQQRPGQFVRFNPVSLTELQTKREQCWYWLWQQLSKLTPPAGTAD